MKLAKATVESAKGDDIHLKIEVQFLFPGARVTSKNFPSFPSKKKESMRPSRIEMKRKPGAHRT